MTVKNSTNKPPTQFNTLVSRLIALPLWVKQAIYCIIKDDLAKCSDIELIDKIDKKIIQLYEPLLTSNGLKVVENKEILAEVEKLNKDHISFLECSSRYLNLLEIAHRLNWSFKYSCEVYLELTERGYVDYIRNNQVLHLLHYITGRIRLGEFLVRTNRINTEQLDKALFTKRCSEDMGSDVTFKEILVNFNYIKEAEIYNVSAIKESAKQYVDIIDQTDTLQEEIHTLQEHIRMLEKEKRLMEKQMSLFTQKVNEKNLENIELSKQLAKYSNGFLGKFLTAIN